MKTPSKQKRLPRAFYNRPTEVVARELLGKALLRYHSGTWLGGLIVETEAYLSLNDLASHSARGRTPSNQAMFGRPGTLYVYPIHAKHCMNVVTDQVGCGSAVLIRALEPVWGIEKMKEHRQTNQLRKLTRGPAMLCQALAVDRSQDNLDLLSDDEIRITHAKTTLSRIQTKPRIGISQAKDLQLRYFVDGNWYVSGLARDHDTPPAAAGRLLNPLDGGT